MSHPVRLPLSRRKGFDLQALSQATNGRPAINVARPGKFGNPFVIGEKVDRRQAKLWGWWPLGFPDFLAPDAQTAVRRFAACLALDEAIHVFIRHDLGGKNLACWCKPGSPCHADVLLELANRPVCEKA